ncbi:MAG: peptidase M28, partial [Mangrovimonas sp.]|nr:peptidase M28 [Mangrovimonas sp.]
SNMASVINGYAKSNLVGFSEVSQKYSLFMRSDNFPFYQEFHIPSHTISSCDLTNFDYYHHVDDEVDKMNFKFMAELVKEMIPVMEAICNTPTPEIKLNEE